MDEPAPGLNISLYCRTSVSALTKGKYITIKIEKMDANTVKSVRFFNRKKDAGV